MDNANNSVNTFNCSVIQSDIALPSSSRLSTLCSSSLICYKQSPIWISLILGQADIILLLQHVQGGYNLTDNYMR